MIKCFLFVFLVSMTTALDEHDCRKSSTHPNVCEYMAHFHKQYSNHTELNLRSKHILAVEKVHIDGVHFGHTSRSDRFKHELARNSLLSVHKAGQPRHPDNEHKQLTAPYTLPPIDWRDINGVSFVTDVKYQGDCGGCYAFAAATVLEYWSRKHGFPKSISVQHLLDCTSDTSDAPNDGCDGGLMEYVYQYGTQGAVVLENQQPFSGLDMTCPAGDILSHVAVSNWKVIERETFGSLAEHELEKILHQYGPVSVGIDSTNWDNYKSGIFKHTMCSRDIDHAVTIVGYTRKAWIIKNSWGKDWGDNGYLYLERGHNACGVTEYMTYVTQASPISEKRTSKLQWLGP